MQKSIEFYLPHFEFHYPVHTRSEYQKKFRTINKVYMNEERISKNTQIITNDDKTQSIIFKGNYTEELVILELDRPFSHLAQKYNWTSPFYYLESCDDSLFDYNNLEKPDFSGKIAYLIHIWADDYLFQNFSVMRKSPIMGQFHGFGKKMEN